MLVRYLSFYFTRFEKSRKMCYNVVIYKVKCLYRYNSHITITNKGDLKNEKERCNIYRRAHRRCHHWCICCASGNLCMDSPAELLRSLV